MKQFMLLGKFAPTSAKIYPEISKWDNKIIALEGDSFINHEQKLAYMISPFWVKAMQNNGNETPKFGNVLAQDFVMMSAIECSPVKHKK